MEIILKRTNKTSKSTIGEFTLGGIKFYTLEDTIRDNKLYGKTAIPKGRYRVVISYSPRFKQLMPLLLNVPNYKGVRIHWGNTAEHTEGCILVGFTKAKDFIGESRKAYAELMKILNRVNKKEAIWITIS